ncbi:MAG TPA: hypothetical protein VHR66_07515 [Gemmataceae bacterium]|jgi:hypothetical protein|nr:hypothetical protein [Gemmataceae bacterium]
MRLLLTSLVLLASVAVLPRPAVAADPDALGMMAAGRELNRQITALQDHYGSSNALAQINGFFKDTMNFQTALIELAQKVRSRASREELALGFDNVDKQLKGILDETKDVASTDAAVKMICRRLSAADASLHFALYYGDETQAIATFNRQVAGQDALAASLADNLRFVVTDPAALKGWLTDLGAVQDSIAALTKFGKGTPTLAEMKDAVAAADKAWANVIGRYETSPAAPSLRGFVSQLDTGFYRLSQIAGVKDRRVPFGDGFSD